MEARYQHKNGALVPVLCRGEVIEWTVDGCPKRMVGTHTDLSDLLQSQEEARKLDRRFQLIVEGVTVGLWQWSANGEDADWWSPMNYRLYGLKPGEIEPTYDNFRALIHPDDRDLFDKALDDHLAHKKPYLIELRILHKTKGYRWFLDSGQAEWDDQGRPIQMLGSVTDIHDQKMAQFIQEERRTELEKANAQLARSNAELDQFAYIASHDLRTPLRGMDNLVAWLQEDLDDKVTPDVQAQFDLLTNRIQRMDSLLTGILQVSRAGQTDLKPEPVDMNVLLRDLQDWIVDDADFRFNIERDLPVITAPKSMLEQIFLNLISNAVKHHDQEQGQIDIHCQRKADEVIFFVRDDGPGVPEEYRQQVFEMFKTLQPRDKIEGNGIGLAIVKRMVQKLGGYIEILPKTGPRGTTFKLSLPIVSK